MLICIVAFQCFYMIDHHDAGKMSTMIMSICALFRIGTAFALPFEWLQTRGLWCGARCSLIITVLRSIVCSRLFHPLGVLAVPFNQSDFIGRGTIIPGKYFLLVIIVDLFRDYIPIG